MSTAATMAAIASSQASIAANQANQVNQANQAAQAKKASQCVGLMDGFTHSTATVEQRQEYAECVALLYPSADAISPGAIGVLLVAVLLGAISGAFSVRRGELMDMTIVGVLGAMAFPLVLTIVWCIWQAIKYALGVTG